MFDLNHLDYSSNCTACQLLTIFYTSAPIRRTAYQSAQECEPVSLYNLTSYLQHLLQYLESSKCS